MVVFKSIIILIVFVGFEHFVESNSDFLPLREKLIYGIKKHNLTAVVTIFDEAAKEQINIHDFINSVDDRERFNWGTLLHQATWENDLNIVKFLAEKGADLNKLVERKIIFTTLPGFYYTPLEIAAQENFIEIAKYFLEKGASTSRKRPANLEEYEKSPLLLAAQYNHTQTVDLLLQYKANVDDEDYSGFTPLFYAIKNGNFYNIFKLLNAGVNGDIVDKKKQYSVLHAVAMAWQNLEPMIKFFLEKGAEMEKPDSSGKTPLNLAISVRRFHAAKALIDNGAILKLSYLQDRYFGNYYPLYDAVLSGDLEMVEKFLKAGADVSIRNGDLDYTVLHAAAFLTENVEPMIKLLVEFKADLTLKSKDGKTPLDLAKKRNNQKAIQVFKEELGA